MPVFLPILYCDLDTATAKPLIAAMPHRDVLCVKYYQGLFSHFQQCSPCLVQIIYLCEDVVWVVGDIANVWHFPPVFGTV
jgi:hypothetical protein